jgi:Flp pilus assembly protein TadD
VSTSGLLLLVLCFGAAAAEAENSTETVNVGGTVSVEELLNPLSGKSLRMLLGAQHALRSGHLDRGMEELRQALADPRAMPYALSMFGSEHLKAGQVEVAIPELEEAVRLLPAHAENHSNLAYALGRVGDYSRAVTEARKALQLNPLSIKTRYVLGLVLLLRPETLEEAATYLKAAAQEFPPARLALATYYEWKGQPEAAERERQTYRGSARASGLSFQAPASH